MDEVSPDKCSMHEIHYAMCVKPDFCGMSKGIVQHILTFCRFTTTCELLGRFELKKKFFK